MTWYAQIVTWLIIILGTINLVRMAFFMVGSDLYAVRLARTRKRITFPHLPTFTVVIPAHNEERTIRASLTSVVQAHYDKDKLQIIVADDGSTDNTVRIVDECIQKYPACDIVLISRPNAGKAHALNNAIKTAARGELVMCLDADSSLDKEALVNAARHFADPRVVALSANVKIRRTGTLMNLIQTFEYLVCYQMKRAQTFFNIEYIIGGIGSTFRRSVLERVGHYDTDTMTEDIDLTMKLLRLGNKEHRAIYGADVIAWTESVLTLRALIKQRFRWKWGRGQTFEKNWDMFFTRHKKHGKFLTWAYLPFALFSDIAFFFEPLVVSYIIYITALYGDWVTLVSAFTVIGMYLALNIVAENTVPWKDKMLFIALAPFMYFFFYLLSFAEYVALIKTYANYKQLRVSLRQNDCRWDHVERAAT